jgi:hypothetical protein
VKHRASPRFWACYRDLPRAVQKLADHCYELLRENPRHPSLQFKVEHQDSLVWFWIGSHAEYDRLVGQV